MKKLLLLICMAAIFTSCTKKEDGKLEVTATDNATTNLALSKLSKSSSSNSSTAKKESSYFPTKPSENFVKEHSFSELGAKYSFKVGACISNDTVSKTKYTDLLKADFNTITATNEFKAYSMLNQNQSQAQNKVVINFTNADKIAKFAQENNIGIRGHVLVWDAYMVDWFFRDGFKKDGEFVSKKVMEDRLTYYITEVITHFEKNFPGVVYCWDVVNEAVADSAAEAIEGNPYYIRKTRGGTSNIFYDVMGEEYVLFSFQVARHVVDSLGADIKLFYNDYSTFYQPKKDHIIKLVQHLNEEKHLCDGVGMQGYIGGYGKQDGCMNANDLKLIKQAILDYSQLGIEVQMTEVAVRNYDGRESFMNSHARFYGNLFRTIKDVNAQGANFTGITIWGINDNIMMNKSEYAYRQNGPCCGLYNIALDPKKAYEEVYIALSE